MSQGGPKKCWKLKSNFIIITAIIIDSTFSPNCAH